jgi:hypothetical protein
MRGRIIRSGTDDSTHLRGWKVILLFAALTFILLVLTDSRNIPKKWVTAIMGTIVPFSYVIYNDRQKLVRWSFWASLSVCLLLHSIAIVIIFRYILIGIQNFSIWFWFPIMLSEIFALLVAVKRIEETLTT